MFGFPPIITPPCVSPTVFWTRVLDVQVLQHVAVPCTLPRRQMKQTFLLLLLSLPKHLVGGDYLGTFLPAVLPPLCKNHSTVGCCRLSPVNELPEGRFHRLFTWSNLRYGHSREQRSREWRDLARSWELHAYFERALIIGDKRMNR